jgi:class 3 adenylate cyclase/tetratricopeptide (TPR) repeat protein
VLACPQCGFENGAGRKFCGSCGSPLALTCESCGAANDPGMRFCGECGSPLAGEAAAPPEAAPERAAERRLVSVLFADLVGFTPLSESRDPEEVRELLSRYFDRCRRLIEIYGGTVEKFIGDAVMAVWGTPVAQEDDAERAVRTALDLVAAVAALGEEVGADLEARAGVLTGEAAVTLNAQAESMVAGDLVNTASRIQSAAEPGTVLVGEATKRASDAAISYEDAGSFELKGKAEPVQLFRAVRVTSIRGGALRTGELEPPFVGRQRELNLVKELFHATDEEGKAQLVSVVGIGGIGKSRLAWEFEKYLDGVAETAYWHRGRCLAYGDGIAYWALAEMVRMRALISDEDTLNEASAKLAGMLDDWFPDADERAWVEPRLAQLLCLGDQGADERQNLFSAWRLFFERLAGRGPVVLVFEDLQWADTSLLDFVEHLLDWSRAHPIFVIALARPELADRRPGFGAGGRNATMLSLEPLPEAAMTELLDGFVPGLPRDLHARILERSEGIPLYAVETVRMLLDRGLIARDGDVYRPTGPIEALDVPETLHALIAARLDGLSADERSLLQDAAVLGKSFTKPGLAALSGLEEEALEPVLASLLRKEVLSVQADPRSPERGQYAFLQDLLRRIAYDTLSRSERKTRHVAAARYLERTLAVSEGELVEVIAAHYLDAYEAAPDADDAAVLRAKAAEHLTLAGERAAAIAASEEAQRYFEKAAALADDDLVRARLLEQAGIAAFGGARQADSVELLRSAIELYNSVGSTHPAARVTAQLGLSMWRDGDLRGGAEQLTQALEVLADDEPDGQIATLVEMLARLTFFLGDHGPARQRVERALEIAEALPAPDVLADALNTKSLLLNSEGRHEEATALLQHALELGRRHDLGQPLIRGLNNLCADLSHRGLFTESEAAAREGAELAGRLGLREAEQQFLAFVVGASWMLGNWDVCDSLVDRFTAGSPYTAAFRANTIVLLAEARGQAEGARRAFEDVAPLRSSEDAQLSSLVLELEGTVLHAEGRHAEAAAALRAAQDVEATVHPRLDALVWGTELHALADAGDAVGLEERLAVHDVLPTVERTPLVEALHARYQGRLLALRGDPAGAAEALQSAARGFASQGLPFYEATTLVELAEAGGGAVPVEARETLERLRAQPWLARVDALERAVTV